MTHFEYYMEPSRLNKGRLETQNPEISLYNSLTWAVICMQLCILTVEFEEINGVFLPIFTIMFVLKA